MLPNTERAWCDMDRPIRRLQLLAKAAIASSRVAAQPRLAANCSCPRRVAKTPAGQSTPFARQVAASRAPRLRMRFLWTGYLSVRHDFWPRPLSVEARRTLERRLGSLRTRAALVSWS